MRNVLTLIGSPRQALTQDHSKAVAAALNLGAEPAWLKEGHACDFMLESREAESSEEKARQALAGEAIDIVAQPLAHRRKKLLVADMDSTIIEQECIDELADALGIKAQIAEITERAMRGELEFEPALRERVGLLKGLGIGELERVLETQITEMPGGRALCATMRAHGATCALVSGGFTFFTARIAEKVGFQHNQANVLLMEDGKLTGKVQEPILGRQAKLDALLYFSAELGLKPEETLAVGDGANDLAMIEKAGIGVAYHAKPVVAAAAPARIDHGDLTSLLYLQGYSEAEITGL
ncbi:phosphoserine phosphatase SerB [Tepidicaulis marinus]|uniref:Phosphoserine phosphatase n=1 Tax=Tepidicaulis marinus TaxID=1333998 RepID=A0A081B9W8_9HYPH|nr:phosphoserine phosphatase SerB [Tepidicaulis marinus]GAK44836.1 phosphoserine phosphatase SerB [Tepidicaulis marinus]